MKYLRVLLRKIIPHYLRIRIIPHYLHIKIIADYWHFRVKLALQNFNKLPPILIYQMGKVGSSAVYESLKKYGIQNPLHHVHFLSYGHLNELERKKSRNKGRHLFATLLEGNKTEDRSNQINYECNFTCKRSNCTRDIKYFP